MICHRDFQTFLLDAEIYVDRIADMRFQDMNATLEAVRQIVRAEGRAEPPSAGGGRQVLFHRYEVAWYDSKL